MYVLLFLLVPVLFLFNTYLALAGLVVAIVAMYVSRTRTASARRTMLPTASPYKAGYED
jgi:hypothetical protein